MTTRDEADPGMLPPINDLEQMLARFFYVSGSAMALSSLDDGRYIEVNDAFSELTGYRREEALERTSQELGIFAPEYRARVVQLLSLRGGLDRELIEITDRFGNRHNALFFVQPVIFRGSPCVMTVATDVTELKATEAALRASEAKYRLLTESVSDVIWTADLSLRLTYVSSSITKLLGYTPREALALPFEKLVTVESVEVARAEVDAYMKRRESERAVEPQVTLELVQYDKNGGLVPVEVRASLLVGPDGRPAGVLGVTRDISERKRAQERERAQQERLMQADKMISLGTLVAGVAHEISNPNQFILSQVLVLQQAFQDMLPILDSYQKEEGDFVIAGLSYSTRRNQLAGMLQSIEQGANRIRNIVTELGDFAKESPDAALECLEVNNVVMSAAVLLGPMLRRSTDRFEIDYGQDIPLLRGRYQRLEQVIINLLQNACQALRSRSEGIRVTTRYRADTREIMIEIRDEGRGIPPDCLPRLADPFFTTRRDQGGMGLGLSIASKIVVDHGGELSFQAGEGGGTMVTVRLPAGDCPNEVV